MTADGQINLASAVLVLVDFQRAFDAPPWPRRWNHDVDRNAIALLTAFRHARIPVIHVRHDSVEDGSSLRPGQPGHAFRPGLEPGEGEAIVGKSVNSAFIGTDLDLRLRRMGAETVLVCGISTDMCVSTTVRMGSNLGWRIVLIGDACDCFDLPRQGGGVISAETVHEVHLATLAFDFCKVMTTRQLLEAVGPLPVSGTHTNLNLTTGRADYTN
jgi:nicotinamidase-related amidase